MKRLTLGLLCLAGACSSGPGPASVSQTIAASADARTAGVTAYAMVDASRVNLYRDDKVVGSVKVSPVGEERQIEIRIDGAIVKTNTETHAGAEPGRYPAPLTAFGGPVLRDPALTSFFADWSLRFGEPIPAPAGLQPEKVATCNSVCYTCNCVVYDATHAAFDAMCPPQDCAGQDSNGVCQDLFHADRYCDGAPTGGSCTIYYSQQNCGFNCGNNSGYYPDCYFP